MLEAVEALDLEIGNIELEMGEEQDINRELQLPEDAQEDIGNILVDREMDVRINENVHS